MLPFSHIWARKPSGHVTNIILTYLKAYIQNLVKKAQVVSEKNKYIEDIQMFLLNMAFISWSEVENIYIS